MLMFYVFIFFCTGWHNMHMWKARGLQLNGKGHLMPQSSLVITKICFARRAGSQSRINLRVKKTQVTTGVQALLWCTELYISMYFSEWYLLFVSACSVIFSSCVLSFSCSNLYHSWQRVSQHTNIEKKWDREESAMTSNRSLFCRVAKHIRTNKHENKPNHSIDSESTCATCSQLPHSPAR